MVNALIVEIASSLEKNTPKLCSLPLWVKRLQRKSKNEHNRSKVGQRARNIGHNSRARRVAVLKKARQMNATARTRPFFSTTELLILLGSVVEKNGLVLAVGSVVEKNVLVLAVDQ